MAAVAYIQTALASLHQAQTDVQSQVNDLQRHADGEKHRLQQEISKLETERAAHMAELAMLKDAQQRTVVENRIRDINRDLDTHRAQIGQVDSETVAAVQRKNQFSKNIFDVASELNRLVSLPESH